MFLAIAWFCALFLLVAIYEGIRIYKEVSHVKN